MKKVIFVKKGTYKIILRDGVYLACRNDLDEAAIKNQFGYDVTIVDMGEKNPREGLYRPKWSGAKLIECETEEEREARIDCETYAIIKRWCAERGGEEKILRVGIANNNDPLYLEYDKFVRETIEKQRGKKNG